MRRAAAQLALAATLACSAAAAPAAAAEPGRVALFEFNLVNTSLEPTRPDENVRLAGLKQIAAEEFAKRGVALVDTGPVAADAAKVNSLHDCNGCELDLARRVDAELAAVGWVQKVSNLILNVNMQIREVGSGRLVRAGSVDIRGNTDEAWRRGVVYLFQRRLYPS
jgi:hypothetical protein